ncbi:hypothetical protein HDV06_002231 [Boothiomyces sp. JEL0866]|nr:hypothetical protein HDV06_002231 [Boothiomyces sp. JEL0866]
MTDVHEDLEAARSKIYGVPNPSKAKNYKKNNILPPVEGGEGHSRANSANKPVNNLVDLESIQGKVDRMRTLLRERELENNRLKIENSMLKQRERKHQKDIDILEETTNDAPRIIKALREEIHNHKAKIRSYFYQIGDDSRVIRQMHEEKSRLNEEKRKLEHIIAQAKLAEQSNLALEYEKITKKHNALELTHKEKDKDIASLSIYRYNAIHRKNEICKACAKRQKDEAETKRKNEIRATSAEVFFQPAQDVGADASYVYSSVILKYTDDPAMVEGITKRKLDVASFQKSLKKPYLVEELAPGKVYYFNITAGHDGVFGPPSKPFSILVDALPNCPTAVSAEIMENPVAFKISFEEPALNKGSEILRYKVYHSSTPDFRERFLALDVAKDQVDQEKDHRSSVILQDPHYTVPYYFKVSSVNTMGESPLSEASSKLIIDFPPNQPLKPKVKRASSSTIQIATSCGIGQYSPPTCFKVSMYKVNKDVEPNELFDVQEFTVSAVTSFADHKEMHLTIDMLSPGTTYKFQVVAINAVGSSTPSEWSDEVDIGKQLFILEHLVPALTNLSVEISSLESILVKLPSVADISKPTIIGYKVRWYFSPDMVHLIGQSDLIPVDQSTYTISHLIQGETYYIIGCFVGENEEGMSCFPIYTPLAASIELPPSPIPETGSEAESQQLPEIDDSNSSIPVLRKNSQNNSNLSINQRVANMHHGMPAYHEPPVDPLSRQNSFKPPLDAISRQGSFKNSLDELNGSKTDLRKKKLNKRKSEVRIAEPASVSRQGSLPQLSHSNSQKKLN